MRNYVLLLLVIGSCTHLKEDEFANSTKNKLEGYELKIPAGLIEPDIPINNPLTEEKVLLGSKLFFEARISKSGKTSCATCHNPSNGFSESKKVSISDNGKSQMRNSITLLNVGFLTSFGWDGRFRTLEEQVLDPFHEKGDMGLEVEIALDTISRIDEYNVLFRKAYNSEVTTQSFANAIASFQRSLLSGGTRFDQYLFQSDSTALTENELLGLETFLVKGSCINCHDIFHRSINPLGGALAIFTDNRFHNLGVGYTKGRMTDLGRYNVTRNPDDWGAFKTPTLRNIELTAPYMHDGSIATLEEVVDFYNRGGNSNPNISPSIRPLFLSADEKNALVQFLKCLTSDAL